MVTSVLRDQEPASFRASRRRFLRGVLLGAPAVVALGGPRLALASALEERSLEFVNTHTGETLKAAYFSAGRYCEEALRGFDHLLRDHRSGEATRMDRGLFDLLHDVAALAGRDARFEVISGYRSPETNAMLNARSSGVARHSLHMDGRAIDIRLAGYRTERLRDVALSLKAGGVGYYRKSDFVHLDTGRFRTWAG